MIREGSKVEWSSENGKSQGVVKQVYNTNVSRTFDGKEVFKEANTLTPAYLIEQNDGVQVLKSSSEVSGKE